MLQSFAINTGNNAQIWMLDLSTDPPTRILMDYYAGASAHMNDPKRWRPEQMPDAEYAAAVKAFEETNP